jgi:DNA polymerase/3'-5' exonuclease PolX
MLAQDQVRPTRLPENQFVAAKLDEMVELREQQSASEFRVRAYHDATVHVALMPQPVTAIYRQNGRPGLKALPTVGASIAAAIAELLDTGRLGRLDRLRGSASPETLLQTVAMIGPRLVRLISNTFHIETPGTLELPPWIAG